MRSFTFLYQRALCLQGRCTTNNGLVQVINFERAEFQEATTPVCIKLGLASVVSASEDWHKGKSALTRGCTSDQPNV